MMTAWSTRPHALIIAREARYGVADYLLQSASYWSCHAGARSLEDRAEDAARYDDRPRADPGDSITVYAPGSNGNVAPIARINGPLTGLGHPMGIAVGP
ncbi:MAG TPA: hypothetical protein VKV03_19040 [Candidatus Binataceae bacterium]|nr:hypothetical protein [Candidatus Binataceae bacterium]